ncbi:PHD/YefM family antitoxin component YafN of YafNO toxin-antitoxin module [Mycolicibacterium sp. BK634]|uniref:type II toxin-antitoxin system Phd/YefM family antitoxin n=1 Tax=Mycolicibacterium sp. BK634 TaxID=2587099 RepID=UPI00161021AC|nr:type II toxin-antitoxin system Phd/YefM family antitoxin [Mycolicibacterium sp. BK634]MBB3752566.1 PHD/YefM family antitoxin component YafN of YafNO toxin-antitoxin module [Mycolicibacterium sp. BK634]
MSKSSDKRQSIGAMVRDVANNEAEYTITRGGVPAAVILPYCKVIALRAAVDGSE